jgi:4-hydroxy-tetrahydrodipicolinate synthase
MPSIFAGVMPAITTPFAADGGVDHPATARQVRFLLDQGCTGVVPCGSLGEGSTLAFEEKLAVMRTCVGAAGGAPVVPGIAAAATAEAVALAEGAAAAGCAGLMVLPPYIYSSDWNEMSAHVGAVMRATPLPCLLYNNPVAYRTDFLPEQIAELAMRHPNLAAVKESSGDVRRVTAIRALLGERLAIGVGVDDVVVEGVAAGAAFWIAGLADALPAEAVALFEHARAGRLAEASALYAWFLPLLRFDTVTKFVQLIKLVQERCGVCSARTRAPRLALSGAELARAEAVVTQALATRPAARRLGARA